MDNVADDKLEVPDDVLAATAALITTVSALHPTEQARRDALDKPLGTALGMPFSHTYNRDSTVCDGTLTTAVGAPIVECAAFLFREDKREVGNGGCDPTIQAGLSAARFWTHDDVSISPTHSFSCLTIIIIVVQHVIVRNNTCCPTFLLANAGPWLAVLGFVFTDKIVCQHLTDLIWIGFDSVLNERHTVRVARILHALGRNLGKLKKYYELLSSPSSSSQLNLTKSIRDSRHFFPSVNTYYDSKQDTNVKFDYIRPLETDPACITFLAQTCSKTDSRLIVVKFIEWYGEPAHRLLAEHDFAPQLFYFGRVSKSGTPSYRSLRMVVMEYLQGSTVAQLLADPSRNHPTHILDLELIAELERIIKFLHSHDYVYGDLRGPNIMITLEKNIKLIDFDWAGKVGHVKYSNFLSPKIGWPAGAERGKPITAQHDLEMTPNVINPR